MQKDIKMILISLNVFSNYAYCVQISNFYFHFYYGETSKEDPKNDKCTITLVVESIAMGTGMS